MPYQKICQELRTSPRTWLITGVAGFIGSHLLENLLKLEQTVVGLDNLFTGHKKNLADVKASVSAEQWKRFSFIDGDIRDESVVLAATQGVDCILHHAALGSIPRSIDDPALTDSVNVHGTVNVFHAAIKSRVRRVVYASSSSVYGDHPALPKVEDKIGKPLNPYAASKWVNEIYAAVFAENFGLESMGLRYFNVFGARQDPQGAYAAVIPRWIAAMMRGEKVIVYGDGESSRDFCYVKNVVQTNILAATTANPLAVNQVYNIACGQRTTLHQLFLLLKSRLTNRFKHLATCEPQHQDFRQGDIRHSHADISKAQNLLGYKVEYSVEEGLTEALSWYERER